MKIISDMERWSQLDKVFAVELEAGTITEVFFESMARLACSVKAFLPLAVPNKRLT